MREYDLPFEPQNTFCSIVGRKKNTAAETLSKLTTTPTCNNTAQGDLFGQPESEAKPASKKSARGASSPLFSPALPFPAPTPDLHS